MGDQIQFTSDGKILFNNGQIVFNCDCCNPGSCSLCSDGTEFASTVDVLIEGMVNNDPITQCADCVESNGTYTLDSVGDCVWELENAFCGHKMLLYFFPEGPGVLTIRLEIFFGIASEAWFRSTVSSPLDCSLPYELDFVDPDGSPFSCDITGITVTFNP